MPLPYRSADFNQKGDWTQALDNGAWNPSRTWTQVFNHYLLSNMELTFLSVLIMLLLNGLLLLHLPCKAGFEQVQSSP